MLSLDQARHNTQAQPSARLLLWEHIYGDGPGRISLFSGIRDGAELKSTRPMSYAWPEQAAAASDWIDREAAAGRDTFMCAHLLTGRERKKQNAAPVTALWVDGDGAQVPEDLPAPTAIVRSSPGREQLYWRLTQPIDPARAEEINRRLAHAMGADPSGWDLTQLLRPPGTPNRKYPDAPAVALTWIDDGCAYDPDELERILPPAPPRATLAGEMSADEPPVILAGAALEWWTGTRQASDRSGTLYAIAKELRRGRASVSTIAAAIADRDLTIHANHPDGPKYAGRPDAAERYRETALKAAAAVETEPTPATITFDAPAEPGADSCAVRVADLEQLLADERAARIAAETERDAAKDRHSTVMQIINNPTNTPAESIATIRALFEYERLASQGKTEHGRATLYLPELTKGVWVHRETGEILPGEPEDPDERKKARYQASIREAAVSRALKTVAERTGAFEIDVRPDPKTRKPRMTIRPAHETTIETMRAVARTFVAVDRKRGPGRGKPKDPRLAAVEPCQTCGDVDILVKADAYCTGCGEHLGRLPDEIIPATTDETEVPIQIESDGSPPPSQGRVAPNVLNTPKLKRSHPHRSQPRRSLPIQVETHYVPEEPGWLVDVMVAGGDD